MSASFFEQPILNSPYEYPDRHWELDGSGQPTTHLEGECQSLVITRERDLGGGVKIKAKGGVPVGFES